MNVYLSYRYGDKIEPLIELLRSHNLQVFDSQSDLQYGASVQQTIKSAIKECDLVVLVYSEKCEHEILEAGIAIGMNKPVFVVLSKDDDNSHLLYDSTTVRANPDEIVKIKFSFDFFVENVSRKRHSRGVLTTRPMMYGGGEIMPLKEKYDVAQRYEAIKDNSHFSLETFLGEVFREFGLSVVKAHPIMLQKKSWEPDFSIWHDDLTPILGNPILVEVKTEITHQVIERIEKDIAEMRKGNLYRSILVFYDRLRGVTENDLPNTPTNFYIKISTLVDHLQQQGFTSSIRKIRNQIAHNQ